MLNLKQLYDAAGAKTAYSRWAAAKLESIEHEKTKEGRQVIYTVKDSTYIILAKQILGDKYVKHIQKIEFQEPLILEQIEYNLPKNEEYFFNQIIIIERATANIPEGYMMPSELGTKANLYLERLDLQIKVDGRYIPTEIGKPYCLVRIIQSKELRTHLIWEEGVTKMFKTIDIINEKINKAMQLTNNKPTELPELPF